MNIKNRRGPSTEYWGKWLSETGKRGTNKGSQEKVISEVRAKRGERSV